MNESKPQDDLPEVLDGIRSYLECRKRSGLRLLYPDAEQAAAVQSDEESLEAVKADLGECTRCRLHQGRRKIVFGEGNPNARLMFVGEGPGADEDVQGRPFVGRAGQLLTKIIQAIDLERADVYIANIVKCRPPGNRDPQEDEIQTCLPFLRRQLEAIQPRVVCALGNVAARTLLQTQLGITRLRGRFHVVGGMKVMPTYHPSYLLRSPEKKKETWVDMQMIQQILD